jgi:hypothetical protein
MESRHWTPVDLYAVIVGMPRRPQGPPSEHARPGRCPWCLLREDPGLAGKTLAAIGCALDNGDLESAVQLLVLHQYTAVEPWEAAEEAVIEYPALFRHPLTSELRAQIEADGFVPLPCDRAVHEARPEDVEHAFGRHQHPPERGDGRRPDVGLVGVAPRDRADGHRGTGPVRGGEGA